MFGQFHSPRTIPWLTDMAKKMSERAKRPLSAWHGDRGGASIIIFALSLPVLIGFIGLGVETAFWYLEKRELQEAVDSAALAGAFEKLHDDAVLQARLEAAAAASVSESGFTNPTTITVNSPPLSGFYVGDASAVEAILTESYGTHFAAILGMAGLDIQTRAVAKVDGGSVTTACILSLYPCFSVNNEGPGIQFQGALDLDAPGCAIHSSDACQGINVPGNPDVEAQCITAAGGVDDPVEQQELEESSRDFELACGFPQVQTAGPANPYETVGLNDLSLPDCSATTALIPPPAGISDTVVDGTVVSRTFRPGRYCSSAPMQFLQQGENILQAGLYYIESDILINGADGAFVCDGPCTIVQPGQYTFDFRGNGDLIITAPIDDEITDNNAVADIEDTTDAIDDTDTVAENGFGLLRSVDAAEWAGVALYNGSTDGIGDGNDCANKLNGNGVMNIVGAVLYPNTCIVMTGNLSTDVADCFQLIGGNITLAGSFDMGIGGCDDSYNLATYPPIVGLVE